MMKSPIPHFPPRLAPLLVLLLLSPELGAAPVSTSPALSLWNKGVASAARSADFLPGSIFTEVTVTDAKGNLKTSQRTWSRLSVGADGAVVTTVLRSIKNGRDDTRDAQAQLDRNPERSRFDSSLLPMMPSNRERVEVAPTGSSRTIGRIACTGFSFRMKGERGRMTVGTAWLDGKTGAPVLLEFTFDPLPTGATVIRNTLHFETAPGGAWHLDALDTYAEGRLLFFERIFRLHMEFSDYFPYPPHGRGASH